MRRGHRGRCGAPTLSDGIAHVIACFHVCPKPHVHDITYQHPAPGLYSYTIACIYTRANSQAYCCACGGNAG